jgi:hypothetical protein
MSKDTMAFAYGAAQKYTYGHAYAIQTSPIMDHEEDGMETLFLAADGRQTCWPNRAQHFDDAAHAIARMITLRMPRTKGPDGATYPRVVQLVMQCMVEAVAVTVAKDVELEAEIA